MSGGILSQPQEATIYNSNKGFSFRCRVPEIAAVVPISTMMVGVIPLARKTHAVSSDKTTRPARTNKHESNEMRKALKINGTREIHLA
jgi:hypothetical protein